MFTRRQFLTYLGIGTYSALRSGPSVAAATLPKTRRRSAPRFFKPIPPSGLDNLIVPSGFRWNVVAKQGDSLGCAGPLGPESFGSDNDFLAFFPIDALAGKSSRAEGLLWVNHEWVTPFVSGHFGKGGKSKKQIELEKLAVGGSVLHIKKHGKEWRRVEGSKYTRRLSALYPRISVSGPVREKFAEVTGTLANCSGGRTPWHTVLSCEEGYQSVNEDLRWGQGRDTRINEDEYGFVVEIDPFGELPPVKHSALGRFSHENAAVTFGASKRLVIYMGDDANDQFLYKFVSENPYAAGATRAEKRKLLESGVLYVANFLKGEWIALDRERTPLLKKDFSSQAAVLFDTRRAAALVKATPLDRPEDCEIHPRDGSLYVAFTNNERHGNFFGQIVRLVEKGDDAEAEKFRFEIFLAGGPQSGLACPDNLLFDKRCNLWVACDIGAAKLRRGAFETFLNNGLFVVPTEGAAAGEAFQFASGPVESELTGPCFTEDGETLFLSVQHPGVNSKSLEEATSHWPEGGAHPPRGAVVAITGF